MHFSNAHKFSLLSSVEIRDCLCGNTSPLAHVIPTHVLVTDIYMTVVNTGV